MKSFLTTESTEGTERTEKTRFLVRANDGYAFRFSERVAVQAPDREATVFGSPAEAAAAVARCGLASRRGLQIEELNPQMSQIFADEKGEGKNL